jgi:transposase InsO family protein
MTRHGKPQIVNTDQGSQFTSLEFTAKLKGAEVAISMDGKGVRQARRDGLREEDCHHLHRSAAPVGLRDQV